MRWLTLSPAGRELGSGIYAIVERRHGAADHQLDDDPKAFSTPHACNRAIWRNTTMTMKPAQRLLAAMAILATATATAGTASADDAASLDPAALDAA